MFWLLSLLIPGMRRESSGNTFNDLNVMLHSPKSRGLLFKVIGMSMAIVLAWLLIAAFLSLLNVWLIVLLVMCLGGVVAYREWQNRQREIRIHRGLCAQCGYDLRATPARCPECGRDASLDEPMWRRMRRQLEARLAAIAQDEPAVPIPVVPLPAPGVKLVTRTPDLIEGPIPLEGNDEPHSSA